MSWLGEAFSYFRRLAFLDDQVGRLTDTVDKMQAQITDHDRRLVRIETIIEFARGAAAPRPPRLPR